MLSGRPYLSAELFTEEDLAGATCSLSNFLIHVLLCLLQRFLKVADTEVPVRNLPTSRAPRLGAKAHRKLKARYNAKLI
mgnify:FL=1